MDEIGQLLEALASSVGCIYLSDLSSPEYRQRLFEVVRSIPAGRFTPAQWNGVTAYLFSDEPDKEQKTPKDAWKHLLEKLADTSTHN